MHFNKNFAASVTAKDKQPQEESKQSARQVTLDSKYSDLSKLYLQKLFSRNKNGSLRSSKKDSPPQKIAITPSISDLNSTMFRQKKQQSPTPHEIVSLQAKSIHNQGQRFYCEEQNVTLISNNRRSDLKDDDILLCSKSNKRKIMNKEVLNRPNTQEGTVNSFYFKKKTKRNI